MSCVFRMRRTTEKHPNKSTYQWENMHYFKYCLDKHLSCATGDETDSNALWSSILPSSLRENVLTINQKHHNSITSASLEDTSQSTVHHPRDITSNLVCFLWTDSPYLLPNLLTSKPCLKLWVLGSKKIGCLKKDVTISAITVVEKEKHSHVIVQPLGTARAPNLFMQCPFCHGRIIWTLLSADPSPAKNPPAGHISLGIDIVPLHCHTWHLIHSFRCSF